ncbi:SDR family NAD(P)-dependent oxidoreductase [Gracilimonas sediminicola]|uniref:SDR family oxidoreductase n=1 Tax=Gracilimonas sediminicola TaxID=2952158 RepID=A0A9X2RCM4_9BACT|nr:SDR family oxidoreductase [Gracilimonas sediminicola]MCP9290876.1 SDR family oxidoreductase [Gracilimonas sediminicola]
MSKTILVTGASRGIGYETALKLASENHTVIATARSQDKLQELSNTAENGKIIPVTADLTKPEDITKIAAAVESTKGLDGLINNAGAVHRQAFMDTDIEVFKKLMDVNVYGIVRLTQALKPHLRKGSHILNISSMSGYQGSLKFGGLSAYGAAKAAVVGLSEVLSAEFAEDNIAVNCLCIGAVQTEMLENAFPGFEAPVSPQQMGSYIANFILTGHQFYNGKVLPVALNDPS